MEEYEIHLDDIVSRDNLKKNYRTRNQRYVYKRVNSTEIQNEIENGWEVTGSRKRKVVRLRKRKDVGLDFQDSVWCIFYKMGFSEMNKSREFAIPRYGLEIEKNIDIFAKDENFICLVECKAAESPHTKKSLGVSIDQYANLHKELEQSVRAYYKSKRDDTKYRFRWLLALKNIDLNENDYIRAKTANIMVVDDGLIQYYDDLSRHFGSASRYQFLSDLYPGMIVPEMFEPVPAIKGKMGGVVFYSFVIEPEKLLKIAYISHRGKTNEESKKTYQRMATKKRLNTIAKYISERQGIFPTSIVLNIETDNKGLVFDQAKEMAGKNAVLGTLHLPNKLKTAWLIDGQHRLFAYSGLNEAATATLPVIAFEDLDASTQQQLFIDINGEQVRVPKNLLVDLYDDLHWNSERPKDRILALISKFVKNLNESSKSPLRDRIIKIGGRKTRNRNLTLTTLNEEIRRSQLFGYVHSVKAKDITPGPLYKLDLDSSLQHGLDVISGYYSLYLENENIKAQWEKGSDEGGYICTNQGIIATLRVLKAIFDHLEQKDQTKVRNRNATKLMGDIKKYLSPVIEYLGTATPQVIKEFRQRYAQAGVQSSTYTLLKVINEKYPGFEPSGLKDFILKTDTTNNQEAYQNLSEIEKLIHKHIITELKKKFGEGYSNWWHKGIKDSIRNKAVLLANNEGHYDTGFENYMYLIDLKDVIEDNWDIFSEIYTIEAKANDSKAKRLRWYTEINKIRNIVAHPPSGGVSDEQLEFVIRIKREITERLSKK
ncbi:MAG: DGQHR domain-containing protein [Dehalococcoidales bacterium]